MNLLFASGIAIIACLALMSCGGSSSGSTNSVYSSNTSSSIKSSTVNSSVNNSSANNSVAKSSLKSSTSSSNASTAANTFTANVWADNWFSLYVNDTKVAEDSVPITTERSFNSETFSFNANFPFELNFIIKDYKENDTGLEYIGTAHQQIGDGGFIMQITNASTGKLVAVSSTAFKCLVIHKAPLHADCVNSSAPTVSSCGATILDEPENWKSANFDKSGWENATTYTAEEVGVKDGYYDLVWNESAQLIWTSDLKIDNTLLCKLTVTGE